MRLLAELFQDWLSILFIRSCIERDSRVLTRAWAARLLCTAAREKRTQASSNSFIALDASGDRGPRVTMVPNTI